MQKVLYIAILKNYEHLFLLQVCRNLALMFKYFSDILNIFFGHYLAAEKKRREKRREEVIYHQNQPDSN